MRLGEPVRIDFTPEALARSATRNDVPDAYVRIGSGRIPIAYDVVYRLVIVVAP